MGVISFRQKGDFNGLSKYLTSIKKPISSELLERYASAGVAALSASTPVDTGLTASSWYSKVKVSNGSASITFCNSNIQNGVPIAIILQYGHATNNGGWVEGRDYINPAVRPVFDKIAKDAWEEVRST